MHDPSTMSVTKACTPHATTTPTHTVVLALPGSSSSVNKQTKGQGIEEHIRGVEIVHRLFGGHNPLMWDTLRFNRFKVFTKPRGPYIPAWAHEFYSAYSDWVPQGKKKASAFKLVDFIVIRGKKVKCRIDDINVEFKWATEFMHDYKS